MGSVKLWLIRKIDFVIGLPAFLAAVLECDQGKVSTCDSYSSLAIQTARLYAFFSSLDLVDLLLMALFILLPFFLYASFRLFLARPPLPPPRALAKPRQSGPYVGLTTAQINRLTDEEKARRNPALRPLPRQQAPRAPVALVASAAAPAALPSRRAPQAALVAPGAGQPAAAPPARQASGGHSLGLAKQLFPSGGRSRRRPSAVGSPSGAGQPDRRALPSPHRHRYGPYDTPSRSQGRRPPSHLSLSSDSAKSHISSTSAGLAQTAPSPSPSLYGSTHPKRKAAILVDDTPAGSPLKKPKLEFTKAKNGAKADKAHVGVQRERDDEREDQRKAKGKGKAVVQPEDKVKAKGQAKKNDKVPTSAEKEQAKKDKKATKAKSLYGSWREVVKVLEAAQIKRVLDADGERVICDEDADGLDFCDPATWMLGLGWRGPTNEDDNTYDWSQSDHKAIAALILLDYLLLINEYVVPVPADKLVISLDEVGAYACARHPRGLALLGKQDSPRTHLTSIFAQLGVTVESTPMSEGRTTFGLDVGKVVKSRQMQRMNVMTIKAPLVELRQKLALFADKHAWKNSDEAPPSEDEE